MTFFHLLEKIIESGIYVWMQKSKLIFGGGAYKGDLKLLIATELSMGQEGMMKVDIYC